jgi:3'-5' exoribonuclease
MWLENCRFSVRGHIWKERYRGQQFHLAQDQRIVVYGKVRQFDRRWIIDIFDTQPLTYFDENGLELIPQRWYVQAKSAGRLESLTQQIHTRALNSFLHDVLADDNLVRDFLQLPASYRHHHAWPGGLLVHSLECAEMVAAVPGFRGAERELGIVAALLHDIGKVRTQGDKPLRWQQRLLLHHELFTFEVLASHLSRLDRRWPEGGMALRYLLSWKTGINRASIPAMTMAELIQSADRISAGLDRDEEAFGQAPKDQSLVTRNGVRRWRTPEPEEILVMPNFCQIS